MLIEFFYLIDMVCKEKKLMNSETFQIQKFQSISYLLIHHVFN